MSFGRSRAEGLFFAKVPGRPEPLGLAYAALTMAAVFWGGSIVGQKIALGAFSAVEVSVFRGVGALVLLVPLWWWQEGRGGQWASHDLLTLTLLGVAVLGNHLLTLLGLRYIGAAPAGIIIGAGPAITAFLSSLLIRDVPFRTVWIGCAISFAGVAFVSGLGAHVAAGDRPLLGGTLVALGLVSWALYTIGSRGVMERLSPLTVNWVTLLISIVLQVPLLALDRQVLDQGPAGVPAVAWIGLLYLIVFATAIGQQAWLYGVRGAGPARAGIFVNLIPVSALLLSAFILGDRIGGKEVSGILLILAGVWLVHRQSRPSLTAESS